MKICKLFTKKFIGIVLIIVIFMSIMPVTTFAATLKNSGADGIPDGYTYEGTVLTKVIDHNVIAIATVEFDITTNTNNSIMILYPKYNIDSYGTISADCYKGAAVPDGYYYIIYYTFISNGPVAAYSLMPLDINITKQPTIIKLL